MIVSVEVLLYFDVEYIFFIMSVFNSAVCMNFLKKKCVIKALEWSDTRVSLDL
jgi:hypothetical protein